jgi:hypothetical protein
MLGDFPPAVQAEVGLILDSAARRLLDQAELDHDAAKTQDQSSTAITLTTYGKAA